MIYRHFLSFCLDYAIRKIRENEEGIEMNVIHQPLVYADDINILSELINTKKKTAEALLLASKEVGLQVNTEETKYMVISLHHNAG
jgi:hypothetical protein